MSTFVCPSELQPASSILKYTTAAIETHDASRPFITLTYAQSFDGSIAAARGTQTALSGPLSMKFTHALRALHDGIVVGVNTIAIDNPSLTTRLVPGKNPRPIIVDTYGRCPLDCKLFTSADCVRPIILMTQIKGDTELNERKCQLEEHGALVIECESTSLNGSQRIDLASAFASLPSTIQSIMVEGGSSIITSCLSSDPCIIDQVILTIAPIWLGGVSSVACNLHPNPPALHRLLHSIVLENDLIVHGRFC